MTDMYLDDKISKEAYEGKRLGHVIGADLLIAALLPLYNLRRDFWMKNNTMEIVA